MKRFFPDLYVKSIKDIDLYKMKRQGIENFIMDIDNTLVETAVKEPDEELLEWFRNVRNHGIKICLVSNNNKIRVEKFNAKLNAFAVHRAVKPMKRAFKRALALLKSDKKNTAVIGDQIFTDIFGGNRMGLYTILVEPISLKESILAKVKRPIEKIVLKQYSKSQHSK